jgi:hypothetical protein
VTVPEEAPEVNNVCAMDVPLPALPPEAPDWAGATQAKVVPGIVPVRVIAVVEPEQIVWATGLALTFGVGLTFTVTVTGIPAQPDAVGVIV